MTHVLALTIVCSLFSICQAFGSSYDDFNAGIRLYNSGQLVSSIASFDAALEETGLTDNQRFTAHLDRGLASERLGRSDVALVDYSVCLTIDPYSIAVLLQRASLFTKTDRFAEAITDLNSVIVSKPRLSNAYTMRAYLLARTGKIDASLADMRNALSTLPSTSLPSIETGILAWQVGDNEKAIHNFSYVVANGPHNNFAWLWLSLADLQMGAPLPTNALPTYDQASWPGPLIDFFLGKVTREAVLATTGANNSLTERGRICEANFYIAEWLLLHHDNQAAKPLMQTAADTCSPTFAEWSAAQIAAARLAQ